MLRSRMVLAEYFMTDEALLLFVMREDWKEPEVVTIERTPREILDFTVQHFQAEAGSEGRPLQSTGEKVRRLDERAFYDFLAPLITPLISTSRDGSPRTNEGDLIWFVPYDVLHYLPLHALKVEGRHLIERNPVVYSPSASVMKYCQLKRRGKLETALVVGDSLNDLPHAREEAQSVAKLFQADPFLGNRANKSAVMKALQDNRAAFDILHFSCHGYFDSADVLNSGIMLAPEGLGEHQQAGSPQSSLTAEEIFNLDINAGLVTLSACESGVSEQRRGDELIGLTRALIHAGLPAVIVSLWAVNDVSTGLLMREFYNKLRVPSEDGETPISKAEALQAAQKYVLGVTAQDCIDYCDRRLRELSDTRELPQEFGLRIDRANFQVLAGDLHSALTAYQEIRNDLEKYSDEWAVRLREQIDMQLPIIEIKAEEAPPEINLEVRPYERIYYWAPFVLVGDWK